MPQARADEPKSYDNRSVKTTTEQYSGLWHGQGPRLKRSLLVGGLTSPGALARTSVYFPLAVRLQSGGELPAWTAGLVDDGATSAPRTARSCSIWLRG